MLHTILQPARAIGAMLASLVVGAGAASAQTAFPTLFLVHNVSDSVVSYRVGADGRPAEVGFAGVPDGPLDIAVRPDGARLAVTHATASSSELLTILSVDSSGALASLASFPIPDSPLAVEWLSDDTLGVSSSVFGSSVFSIYRYTEDPTPTLESVHTVSTGGLIGTIIASADRSILYVNDSFGGTIRVYRVNADGNVLLRQTASASGYPLDITLHPAGTRMYAGGGISGSGSDLFGFDVDADGRLTSDDSPYNSRGDSPAYLCIPASGDLLFVGHGTDATVRSFFIDGEDGSLTYTGNTFDVGLQGTVGDIVELNGYLFVTDESTASDGVTGLYSFAINPDGSFTQNGDILDTGGTRPETMATWNPDVCLADFNADGNVDTLDVLDFLNAWAAGDDDADINGDGNVDTLDVLGFLNAWAAGC